MDTKPGNDDRGPDTQRHHPGEASSAVGAYMAETSAYDNTTVARILTEKFTAAAKQLDSARWPDNLEHVRTKLAAWLRDEQQAVEDNPNRYCGAAVDMANALLRGH